MRSESKQSLKPTELVHEAYLRLVDVARVRHWKSRSHFFGAAAEAMRRILVDAARARGAIKRGGGHAQRVNLDDLVVSDDYMHLVLLIDEAIVELEEHEPEAAAVAKLRIFGGMGHIEAANSLGISRRVADRHWIIARTRLYKSLSDSDADGSPTPDE